MKNYLEVLATKPVLIFDLQIKTIGNPNFDIIINEKCHTQSHLRLELDLLQPIHLQIELRNKIYSSVQETAVIIQSLIIDGIDILPKYDYLGNYINDKNINQPSSYIGYNGTWTFTIDRPFYLWLHKIENQGWLLH
jgi:hypothetical protein